MHEGWEYVVAAYAVSAVTLVAWFWMIALKLRRLRARRDAEQAGG